MQTDYFSQRKPLTDAQRSQKKDTIFSFRGNGFYCPAGPADISFPRFSAEKGKTLCTLCLCGRFIILSVSIAVILCCPLSLHAQPLYTPVTSVILQHKQNKVFLVDIRAQQAFDTLRIPGSLNMPLYAVKTKPFLKAKPLILINEGYAAKLLEQECRELNQNGFNASCLQGGLNEWHINKGPIEGDPFAIKNIRLVSPQTVFQENDAKKHIIIDISETKSKQGITLFPEAVHIPEHKTNKNVLCASVRDLIKKTPSILIFNQDGKGYDPVMKQLSDQGIGPVFYLEGGLSGYEQFMKNLTLSRAPRAARIKSMNCDTCAKGKYKEEVK